MNKCVRNSRFKILKPTSTSLSKLVLFVYIRIKNFLYLLSFFPDIFIKLLYCRLVVWNPTLVIFKHNGFKICKVSSFALTACTAAGEGRLPLVCTHLQTTDEQTYLQIKLFCVIKKNLQYLRIKFLALLTIGWRMFLNMKCIGFQPQITFMNIAFVLAFRCIKFYGKTMT